MIADLTNHLWQSTLFAIAVGLLALALRNNRASIRHGLWTAASLKFFVPFSILMSLGSHLAPTPVPHSPAEAPPAGVAVAVNHIAQPFSETFVDVFQASTATPTVPAGVNWVSTVVLGAWLCGFIGIALIRAQSWRRIRAALLASAPVHLGSSDTPIDIRSAPGLLEPGVVGLRRPILLMPHGIEEHLSPAQMRAVIAHELCHVRRRDNLTAAIHMVVEAVFWFHPVVWWIGGRLVDERERACDEYVLNTLGEPQAYAEGILNVCKRYVESPLACVSGVTGLASRRFFRGGGSDLKKRIEAIMFNRIGTQLSSARRLALAAAAVAAIALPLLAGVATAPLRASAFAAAQTAAATADKPTFDVVSIKPCPGLPPAQAGRGIAPFAPQMSPGYVHWDCVTLFDLITQAYGGANNPLLNNVERPAEGDPEIVRGGSSWVRSDKFTIEAKGAGVVPEIVGPVLRLPPTTVLMIRAMLEDRFQLKLRRLTEERPMYALGLVKGGLKITAAAPSKCWPRPVGLARNAPTPDPPPGFEGTMPCGYSVHQQGDGKGNTTLDYSLTSMTDLARHLSTFMDMYVLDKTGVDGRFNFNVLYAPDDRTPNRTTAAARARRSESAAALGVTPSNPVAPENRPKPDGPSIFKALESLGLELRPSKGPAEYFVIDSVQKPKPDGPASAAGAPPPARAAGAGRLR